MNATEHLKWQRETALRKIEAHRKELADAGRPVIDTQLAEFGAKYVGADPLLVLRWMGASK